VDVIAKYKLNLLSALLHELRQLKMNYFCLRRKNDYWPGQSVESNRPELKLRVFSVF
jgi:hypothetical protein